jgi:hypothetical protein
VDSPQTVPNDKERMIRHTNCFQGSWPHEKGVWFRVLPTEDPFDDICDAMNQNWEDFSPLLSHHGLLACDIRDDVKN